MFYDMRSKRRNQKEYRIHFKFFLALNLFCGFNCSKKNLRRRDRSYQPLGRLSEKLFQIFFFNKTSYQNIFASHFGQLAIIFLWTF